MVQVFFGLVKYCNMTSGLAHPLTLTSDDTSWAMVFPKHTLFPCILLNEVLENTFILTNNGTCMNCYHPIRHVYMYGLLL